MTKQRNYEKVFLETEQMIRRKKYKDKDQKGDNTFYLPNINPYHRAVELANDRKKRSLPASSMLSEAYTRGFRDSEEGEEDMEEDYEDEESEFEETARRTTVSKVPPKKEPPKEEVKKELPPIAK